MRLIALLLALASAAGAAEVAAPSACPFDAIPKAELISRTRQFSLKPTQGMMGVEGYSLLIPREHAASFSDLAPAAHAEFRKQKAQAAAAVEAAYGAPVVFEHGVTGQSIGHAHLHIVPGIKLSRLVEETERLLEGVSYSKKTIDAEDAGVETARAKAQAGGYLYLEDPKAGKAVVYAVAPEQGRAMILRKAAAAALGRPELSDWRKVRADPAQLSADEQLRRSTIDRLSPQALARRVLSVLTPDLLKPKWRKAGRPAPFGHCYAATEALYHMLGGKPAGWTPMHVSHEGDMHWYLRHESGAILDATAAQFKAPVPYGRAKGGGFLTREPSQRAAQIMRRVAGASQVHPERTAIVRSGESLPIRRALPLMRGSILDYGAGRGSDARFLRAKGFSVDAYDPYYFPEMPRAGKRYDWVMLNYVLNVVVEPAQRAAILTDIVSRLKPGGRVLVAVRASGELEARRGPGWKRVSDGWLTPLGTFQHGYAAGELEKVLNDNGLTIERALSPSIVVARQRAGPARFGKETPAAVYFHRSWEGGAPARLRALVDEARRLLPRGARWNVVKVAHDGRSVSFLWYPEFDSDPHPALRYVYRVDLARRTLWEQDHRSRSNPFILHRKDSFVAPDDPRYQGFRRLTQKEEAAGLLSRNDIGTREGWKKALKAAARRRSS